MNCYPNCNSCGQAHVHFLLADQSCFRTSRNSLHMQVFMPAFPFAALCLLATPVLAPTVQIGLSVATAFTCMSQQFHAWAHTKGSRLPGPVKAMQVRGTSNLQLPNEHLTPDDPLVPTQALALLSPASCWCLRLAASC